MELHQLVKDRIQRMDVDTSILCAITMTIGKRRNEEVSSSVVVKMFGGPSKRTRKTIKKFVVATLGLAVEDILQGTMVASKELAKVIKELA